MRVWTVWTTPGRGDRLSCSKKDRQNTARRNKKSVILIAENGQASLEIQANISILFSLRGKLFVTAEFALKHKKYKKDFVREVNKMNKQIPVYLQLSNQFPINSKMINW